LSGGLDLVVYETPFARGRDATRCGWGSAGVIEAAASLAGLPVIDVAVATIKKFATRDGRASKDMMVRAAQRLGYQGSNEHEADAFWLLKYTEENAEKVQ
jgi:Holliday junction resolvasome RuvABC endonuclease subunit